MTKAKTEAVQRQFREALDALIAQIRDDRSILAALLGGSLSHDLVWARSDIDLVLVTIDDKKLDRTDLSLNADGVNVHALMMPRAEFRRVAEGSVRNSFFHSFLTKSRLVYTHDDTIRDLHAGLSQMGERDRQMQLLRAATGTLPSIYKAHKFLITRGDLEYTALWILNAASGIARMEVIGAGLVADREVIPQALALNPALFGAIYTDLLNEKKTRTKVEAALRLVDEYMRERALRVFAPIIDHLREVGERRSATEIEDHFTRNFDVSGVTTACEYLADQAIIAKAAVDVRLTKRSNVAVQELAFFAPSEPAEPLDVF